jgi:hypothetical protein
MLKSISFKEVLKMPRSVRPFYVEAFIDDRETELKGGPRRLDSGMNVRIYIRDEDGTVLELLNIRCFARDKKSRHLQIQDLETGEIIYRKDVKEYDDYARVF